MIRILVLIYMLLLCGCNSEQTPSAPEETTVPVTSIISSTVPTESTPHVLNAFNLTEYLSHSELLCQYREISGNIVLLTFIGKDEYRNEILDIHLGTVLKEIHTLSIPCCQPDGFWVYESGNVFRYSDPEFGRLSAGCVTVYDYQGEMLRSIPIETALSAECLAYDIASDTLYYDAIEPSGNENKYSVYQRITGRQAEPVFSGTIPQENALLKVFSLQKIGENLLFRGLQCKNAQGSETVSCYGMINLNTHKLQSNTVAEGDADVRYFDSGAFVCETDIPYGKQASGIVHWMLDGKITDISLAYPQECIGAEVSQSGAFFASQMDGTDQYNKQIFRLTVYDENGTKLRSQDMTFPEKRHIEALFISELQRKLYCRMIKSDGSSEWSAMDF